MLSILNSAIAGLFRWLVVGGGIKLIFFAVIGLVMAIVVGLVTAFIPSTSGLTGLLQNLPLGMGWWLTKLRWFMGLGMVAAAYAARFLIRRIPFIG